MKQTYEVKGRVNGTRGMLHVGLCIFEVSSVKGLPSCYTLVVCARGSLAKKEEPIIAHFALKREMVDIARRSALEGRAQHHKALRGI